MDQNSNSIPEYRRKVTVVRPDDVAEALQRDRKQVSRVFSTLAMYGIVEEAGEAYLLTKGVTSASYGLKHPPPVNPYTGHLLWWLPSPHVLFILLWMSLVSITSCVLAAIWMSVDWSGSPDKPSAVAPVEPGGDDRPDVPSEPTAEVSPDDSAEPTNWDSSPDVEIGSPGSQWIDPFGGSGDSSPDVPVSNRLEPDGSPNGQ